MNRTKHGEQGHLNVFVRDQDSIVTSFGKHYRVVATLPDASGLYCRVDHKHGERFPTSAEVLRVARVDQGIKGRWILDREVEHNNGQSTDLYFVRVAR